MGSNLLALQTSDALVVTDADRNRVSIVGGGSVIHVNTGDDSRPNRATEDALGFIHIALRGTGELVMVSPAGDILARSSVCRAPRGLDFDVTTNQLLVACAEGKLVRHSTESDSYRASDTLTTDVDVRDVVIQGERTYVSRLRSAEVLEYRADQLFARHQLPTVELTDDLMPTERAGSRLKPTVAWKMLPKPEGNGVIVLHQRSLLNVVGDTLESTQESDSGGGSSAYGGSNPLTGCSGIVQPAISEIGGDGTVTTSDSIAGVVLAVDMVAREGTSDERSVVIASAGLADPNAPRSETFRLNDADETLTPQRPVMNDVATTLSQPGVFSGGLRLHSSTKNNPRTGDVLVGCTSLMQAFGEGTSSSPTASVAQMTTGELIAFQRDSGSLLRGDGQFFQASGTVDLGGDRVENTGHELFHRDSGGGIACASCHPEGEDDGHVWKFASVGERKTQFLGVHLSETAPFHWDGALSDLDVLMDEVFVTRMGGVFQSKERVESLATWLGGLPAPSTTSQEEARAVARGQELFASETVGCSACHSGNALTDNSSHKVGTSGLVALQTPSLRHVALHPPFMHNGCAPTLRDRFKPDCGGGDEHGHTSHLTDTELDDLIAYMSTL
jgi:mono/diheme cytochrome c family protein